MKGAADGGLRIPHSNTRFIGYNKEKDKFDPAILRKHIFGQHVAEYMRLLKAENPDKYQKHFSVYIKNKIGPDDVEKMWENAHKQIRADPTHKPKPKKENVVHKKFHKQKTNRKQKNNRIKQILAAQTKVTKVSQ